jgi:pSer/pThr/pTyr-binding forkhead associated (FHA) protein
MYMLGISLLVLFILLIYLINKTKQNQLQFRPSQEQSLNPTRQITDYIANADSQNPLPVAYHMPQQNTPKQNTPKQNIQIHYTPQPNDRSILQKENPIMINDQVDQEKEQEDLKTFKPHWSKPDQKSEIKSPEQKSPEQKSPDQKSPDQRLASSTSLHDHKEVINQPQEDDWFERDRNSSTSQIIHKLVNPQNLSKKPNTQELDHKSVPITFQASAPNTQEIKQLAAIKKPEHYFAILEVVYGPMKDAIFFITQRETSIGRAIDATCPLPPSGKNADLAISRYHFSLFKYPNRWHLRCTSSQSMYVNQEQIVKGDEIELEDHDRIRVGQTIFLFKIHKD